MQKFPVANLELEDLDQTATEYKCLMEDHVIAPWFPRCIDQRNGGFRCDFDSKWRAAGPDDKLLEFQARQTLIAAESSMAFPSNKSLLEAAGHGFRFLREVMWDQTYGGWFHLTDCAGRPKDPERKHTHGMSNAIEACVAVYLATDDTDALELAYQGFEWVDANAHDDQDLGYIGPLERDGGQVAADTTRYSIDFIGTPVGLKDMDVNKGMLSALSYCCRHLPHDCKMDNRLDELIDIVLLKFADPNGHPWFQFHKNWTPASSYWKPAESAQAAATLIEMLPIRKSRRNIIIEAATHLVCVAFEKGWSEASNGLLFDCNSPRRHKVPDIYNTPWWTQFELLRPAEYLAKIFPDCHNLSLIATKARRATREFVDENYGGLTMYRRRHLPYWDRMFRPGKLNWATAKGNIWKDASHEGRVLLRLASLGVIPEFRESEWLA